MSPAEQERRVGGRILRTGQTVRIQGARGWFRILDFRGDEVNVYGGTEGHPMLRTFRVERVGTRRRLTAEEVVR